MNSRWTAAEIWENYKLAQQQQSQEAYSTNRRQGGGEEEENGQVEEPRKLTGANKERCTQAEGGGSRGRACIHVHSRMLNVLTMVRKLHSIALMLNLPLLHTGQMVLH